MFSPTLFQVVANFSCFFCYKPYDPFDQNLLVLKNDTGDCENNEATPSVLIFITSNMYVKKTLV